MKVVIVLFINFLVGKDVIVGIDLKFEKNVVCIFYLGVDVDNFNKFLK